MTDTNTTEIVPIAIDVNSETPSVMSPASEIITASPEKNTARPAVLLETSIALRPLAAGPPFDPEPGDHEQRVVDGDGEPDEHDQLRRVGADRPDDLAVDAEDAERRDQRGDGEDQRHDRRPRSPRTRTAG